MPWLTVETGGPPVLIARSPDARAARPYLAKKVMGVREMRGRRVNEGLNVKTRSNLTLLLQTTKVAPRESAVAHSGNDLLG